MHNDHNEPTPVVPLAYQRDDAISGWSPIIRILAILCIIDGCVKFIDHATMMVSVFQSGFWGTYLARGNGDTMEKVSVLIMLMQWLTSMTMVLGAIGCLYRRNNFRR